MPTGRGTNFCEPCGTSAQIFLGQFVEINREFIADSSAFASVRGLEERMAKALYVVEGSKDRR